MVNRAIPLRLLAMPVPCLAKSAISMLLHGLIERQKTKNDMTASLKAIDGNGDLPALMNELAAGALVSEAAVMTVPDNLPPGEYRLVSGVFSAGWGTMYAWNANAGLLTITDAPSTHCSEVRARHEPHTGERLD